MDLIKLKALEKKLFFRSEDVAGLFQIQTKSAHVLLSRYVNKGIFIRLKNNFYVLANRWESYTREDFYRVGNFLQVPSYLSLLSALSFYEVTTQVPHGFFESVCLKRTVSYEVEGITFNFMKLKNSYYFDFKKKNNIFIATKEKAFVDSIYLFSFGKYKLDLSAIDLAKLDMERVNKLIAVFPEKTKKVVRRLCGI